MQSADDVWALLGPGQRVANLLAPPAGMELQGATTHVLAGATLVSAVEGAPSIGGFVTKIVVKRAASGLTDAARAVVAAGAVLALCELRGVTDPIERHGVVHLALTGEEVIPGWQPKTLITEIADESGEAARHTEARGTGGRLREIAGQTRRARKLKPDEDKLWHKALSYVPIVGIVGTTLGAREGLEMALGRAAERLGLPRPQAQPLHQLVGTSALTGAQRAAAKVRETLQP